MSKVYLVQSRERASSTGILAILEKKNIHNFSCLVCKIPIRYKGSETVIKAVLLL
jgi:hypothetical protein